MVMITVEYWSGTCLDHEVSRIPCVGEYVYGKDDGVSYEVVSVAQVLDADEDNEPVAIVRVK